MTSSIETDWEFKDGFIVQAGTSNKLTSCTLEDHKNIVKYLRKTQITKLVDFYGFKPITVPIRTDGYQQRLELCNKDKKTKMEDTIYLWKSDQEDRKKHLILLQGAGDCYEGVWSSAAFIIEPIDKLGMDKYILWGVTNYASICILNPNEHTKESGGGGLRSQIHVEQMILYLQDSVYKKNDKVDVVAASYGGVCLYNFLIKQPKISFEIFDKLVLLDSVGNVSRDILRKSDIGGCVSNQENDQSMYAPKVVKFIRKSTFCFKASKLPLGRSLPDDDKIRCISAGTLNHELIPNDVFSSVVIVLTTPDSTTKSIIGWIMFLLVVVIILYLSK